MTTGLVETSSLVGLGRSLHLRVSLDGHYEYSYEHRVRVGAQLRLQAMPLHVDGKNSAPCTSSS